MEKNKKKKNKAYVVSDYTSFCWLMIFLILSTILLNWPKTL